MHTDLNEKTRGMFSAAQFQKMKRTAVFVNTARGPLVDQKALADALQAGTIFAAGLDVTDPEPPPPDDPLLKLPNVVDRAAHRQRDGADAQRDGGDLRQEPARRRARRAAAGVGEPGGGGEAAVMMQTWREGIANVDR